MAIRIGCVGANGGDEGSRGGRLAQLVERLLYTQDVGGSSPSPPTNDSVSAMQLDDTHAAGHRQQGFSARK
jgi:hypothetical protein